MIGPLYELLRKNRKWNWTKEQDIAFKKAKEHLALREILILSYWETT